MGTKEYYWPDLKIIKVMNSEQTVGESLQQETTTTTTTTKYYQEWKLSLVQNRTFWKAFIQTHTHTQKKANYFTEQPDLQNPEVGPKKKN